VEELAGCTGVACEAKRRKKKGGRKKTVGNHLKAPGLGKPEMFKTKLDGVKMGQRTKVGFSQTKKKIGGGRICLGAPVSQKLAKKKENNKKKRGWEGGRKGIY